ncbi:protein translocase subunit SecD [Dethiothermospora halolimnae]|uniref:protein translocase subunit SecD n=1 Tax=Dethiothermospora halolimnae TaxID=3114390 RepID=UPI003CCBD800
MKTRSTVIFLLIVVVVGFISYAAINGVNLGKYEITTVKEEMDLGLDLAGGVYVVLEAQTDATGPELRRMMEQTKAIINQRVDGLGVSEPNIVIEGEDRIRVELAGVEDTQKAIDMIGKTAQLQFVEPDGSVVITGEHVREATATFESVNGIRQPVVILELNDNGTDDFAEATGRLLGQPIAIVLDGNAISSPVVSSKITNGQARITGQKDIEEASRLANLIRAGALPVEMKELESSVIGPTLGLESLDKSVFAAMIGIILIFLFMIVFYRIPGLIADIALTIFILIILGVMIGIGVKLTLPGIAGLILSIGMAVDANVVIFERIKEEIRSGKTIRASVDAGFKRALSTVLDANITTLIAGIVLYNFGTGPIKGFGVTLMIGIIASMITAVFITRLMLKLVVTMNITKNTKFYGA